MIKHKFILNGEYVCVNVKTLSNYNKSFDCHQLMYFRTTKMCEIQIYMNNELT